MIYVRSRSLWALALLAVLVQSTFAQETTPEGDNVHLPTGIPTPAPPSASDPPSEITSENPSSPSASPNVVDEVTSENPTSQPPSATDSPSVAEITSENPASQTEVPGNNSAVDSVIDKIIEKGRAAIHKVVHDLRLKLDGRLEEIFPHLKEKIESLHGNIDACYDATIGKNETINIFHLKVHETVKKFLTTHGKIFAGMDHETIHKRVEAFLGNLAALVEMLVKCVKDKEQGLPTMKLGLTPLAIYSKEEYQNKILNKNLMTPSRKPSSGGQFRKHVKRSSGDGDDDDQNIEPFTDDSENVLRSSSANECDPTSFDGPEVIPKAFDWRDRGKVTKVYAQHECGSCYVYSTTSAIESSYLIATNKTVRSDGDGDNNSDQDDVHFSVQATLNCMPNGCGGGNLNDPLDFFASQGVTNYENAPYLNRNAPCKKDYPIAFKARTHCYATNLDEEGMQRFLMKHGPAGIAIDAHNHELSFLKDSPYLGPCGKALDHAVLLVGWDEDNWIIKNSWGEGWGIKGYLYLPRGENKCGVQSMYGVPIVDPINSGDGDE